jgi:hypothetical protein
LERAKEVTRHTDYNLHLNYGDDNGDDDDDNDDFGDDYNNNDDNNYWSRDISFSVEIDFSLYQRPAQVSAGQPRSAQPAFYPIDIRILSVR